MYAHNVQIQTEPSVCTLYFCTFSESFRIDGAAPLVVAGVAL